MAGDLVPYGSNQNNKTDSIAESAVRFLGGLVPTKKPAPKPSGISVQKAPKGELSNAILEKRAIININGDRVQVNAATLMRLVKRITQQIGEYNSSDEAYAKYVVPPLRESRRRMVSDLESYFGIHWMIDETTGRSRFYRA